MAFLIVFPMPLYGTGYVFSKAFFRFWVIWTFLWAWVAALIITLLPLWQGRGTLCYLFKLFIGKSGRFTTSGGSLAAGEIPVIEEKIKIVDEKDEL